MDRLEHQGCGSDRQVGRRSEPHAPGDDGDDDTYLLVDEGAVTDGDIVKFTDYYRFEVR